MHFRERRGMHRCTAIADHQIHMVRLRTGHLASLIDVSASGAFIETACRLQPGATVEVLLCRRERVIAVRARVLRSCVSRLLADGIWYRGAVMFERRLAWLTDLRRFASAHVADAARTGTDYPSPADVSNTKVPQCA